MSCGSRLALTLLGGVRRWVFLPSLVVTALALVRIKGGDALSVCFNTIAIIFLTEVTPMLKPRNFRSNHGDAPCRRSTTRRTRWA